MSLFLSNGANRRSRGQKQFNNAVEEAQSQLTHIAAENRTSVTPIWLPKRPNLTRARNILRAGVAALAQGNLARRRP